MKKQNQVSHVTINHPAHRRQWCPIRECDITPIWPSPFDEYVLDSRLVIAAKEYKVSFRVKILLAERVILSTGVIHLFVRQDDGSTLTGVSVRRECLHWENLGVIDGQHQGVNFHSRICAPMPPEAPWMLEWAAQK